MAEQEDGGNACFCCTFQFRPQLMRKITGDDQAQIGAIAEMHREDNGFPSINRNDNSRICFNCQRRVMDTMRSGATKFLEVVQQRSCQKCIICDDNDDLKSLNFNGRLKLFLATKKFSPEGSRSCSRHLNKSGEIHLAFFQNIKTIRKPITLDARESQQWLDSMHSAYESAPVLQLNDETKYSDEDFQILTGIRKYAFQQLFQYCSETKIQRHKILLMDLIFFRTIFWVQDICSFK